MWYLMVLKTKCSIIGNCSPNKLIVRILKLQTNLLSQLLKIFFVYQQLINLNRTAAWY